MQNYSIKIILKFLARKFISYKFILLNRYSQSIINCSFHSKRIFFLYVLLDFILSLFLKIPVQSIIRLKSQTNQTLVYIQYISSLIIPTKKVICYGFFHIYSPSFHFIQSLSHSSFFCIMNALGCTSAFYFFSFHKQKGIAFVNIFDIFLEGSPHTRIELI